MPPRWLTIVVVAWLVFGLALYLAVRLSLH